MPVSTWSACGDSTSSGVYGADGSVRSWHALADRFWPLAQWADWLLPFSGQTLLIVGRKPGLALQRAAA